MVGKNTDVYNTMDRKQKSLGRGTGRGQGLGSLKGPTPECLLAPDKSFLLRFPESFKMVSPARDQVFKT